MKNNFSIPDRLGERLESILTVTGYRLKHLFNPNSHLHCSWSIKDSEIEVSLAVMDFFNFNWVEPALVSLAEQINKYDVALFAPLPCHSDTGVQQTCDVTEIIPIRYTVEYSLDLTGNNEPGYRFTIDLLADLLTKPEIE